MGGGYFSEMRDGPYCNDLLYYEKPIYISYNYTTVEDLKYIYIYIAG